jgi:hypothetical protein
MVSLKSQYAPQTRFGRPPDLACRPGQRWIIRNSFLCPKLNTLQTAAPWNPASPGCPWNVISGVLENFGKGMSQPAAGLIVSMVTGSPACAAAISFKAM